MKLHKISWIWIMLTALTLIPLACLPIQPGPTLVPSRPPTPDSKNLTIISPTPPGRAELMKATVQILMLYDVNGKLTPKAQGSGTIISSTGMILTNARIASPASQGEADMEPDALAIGLIDRVDLPPVLTYFAKVKAVDGYLDLAVIQITSTLDGIDVDPNNLNLPTVKLGNSDELHVGDHLSIIGFPSIGSDPITYLNTEVLGFTSEEGLGNRAWIKTDASISYGNSGGLVADDAGAIIGIPSIVTWGAIPPDCRRVQDTNGDGVIDEKDICVPAGVPLGMIRPVNLALPLIKAVQTEQIYVSPYNIPTPVPTPNSQ